jgi:hypothetical protein
MNFLRQSTAVDIVIGPFLDETDGKTAETALTISQADVRLKKNNGAWAQKNEATSATHEENGYYESPLDATDTNTVGILRVAVSESGALPVFHDFQVIEEAVYDALFAGSAPGYLQPTTAGRTLDVSAAGEAGLDFGNISSGAIPILGAHLRGTMQSGSTASTAVLAAATTIADDLVNNGLSIYIHAGTGAGQIRMVIDWVSSTDTATVSPDWAVTPDNTSEYIAFVTSPTVTATASLPLVKAYNHAGSELALAAELAGAISTLNTLAGRITSTVAGYLANNITVPVATNTDMTTMLSRITSGRASNLDNLATATLPNVVWNALRSADTRPAGSFGAYVDAAISSIATGGVTAADIAAATWDLTTTGHFTAGSFGAQAKTVLDGVAAKTVNFPADTATVLTGIANKTVNLPADPASDASIPSTAEIAGAVFDEQLSGHLTAGSAGRAITDASDAESAAAILAAIKADTEWKKILANVDGDYTVSYPGSVPGIATVTVKDRTNSTTLVTYQLTLDSSHRITNRDAT